MFEPKTLKSLLYSGILNTDNKAELNEFKQWLMNSHYNLLSTSNNEFELSISSPYHFNQMLAYDSCRFANAAFETCLSIVELKHLPKSLSWYVVKTYYASFFSAHSILRIFGRVCSQLESGHLKYLNQIGQIISLPQPVKEDGAFFCGSAKSGKINLKKKKNTHKDTWHEFFNLLTELEQDVLNVSVVKKKKDEFNDFLIEVKNGLTKNGKYKTGGWFSEFRNEVNYRVPNSTWYPYNNSSKTKQNDVLKLISMWNSDNGVIKPSIKENDNLMLFFYTSTLIINMNYKLAKYLASESSNNKNHFNYKPVKFLNEFVK